MTSWMRVIVASVLVVALGSTTLLGDEPFVVATFLVVAVLAWGWPRLTDSPQGRLTFVMLLVLGGVGLASVWFEEDAPYLEWLPLIAGLGLLWSFIQHLVRGIDASDAVANVSAQVAGLVIVLSVGSWLAAMRVTNDREAILVGLTAVLVALVATALPLPARYTSPLAIVAGGVAAALISALVVDGAIGPTISALLGVAMGILVAAVDRLLGLIAFSRYQATEVGGHDLASKARSMAVQVSLGAAPVALGGVLVYIIERIFVYR